jgi:hypothetical protein
VTGLRVSCHIEVTGGLQNNTCKLAIFGLPLSEMNQLTTFGTQFISQNKNGVSISAGDASGMALVFSGNIWQAYVDGQAQPQVCLRVDAQPGNWYNVKSQTPLSFKGPTKASDVAQKIAGYLGMNLINNGVNTVLQNPYFASDAVTMMQKLSEHAGFDWVMDRGNVTITPPGGSNSGGGAVISPQTGMVSYPIFVSNCLTVKTLLNPNIRTQDIVTVQSSLTPACGSWKVFKIEYDLESLMPHGKWFSTFHCNPAKDSVTPQQ